MPVYEFLCAKCGPFEHWRGFHEAAESLLCPACGSLARRVYSAPGLARTSEAERKARIRNERGAEPRLERRAATPETPAHGGHAHAGHARPWMLGH